MNNMKRNDGSGSKVREKRRCRLLPIGIQRKLFVITAMVAAFVTMMAGTIHTDYREINAGNCAELDNVTAVTLSDPGLTFEGWQLYSSDGTLLETVAPGGRFSAAKFAGRGEVFTVRDKWTMNWRIMNRPTLLPLPKMIRPIRITLSAMAGRMSRSRTA